MAERVWDRFLTGQDRAHVGMSDRRPIQYGERPALLLIDLYRWVFGDRPQPLLEAAKTWPGSCGLAAWEALPHLQRLLGAARAAGIPIIHSTGLEDEEVVQWAKDRRTLTADQMTPEAAERRRRRYQIVDEVAPLPGELVLRKSSPSVFWGTPLVGHLTALGIDTLITGGESTSGCVRASVVDGCTFRYQVIVVEECVFDRHQACHAINLFDMDQKYARVAPLAQALEYLDAARARKAPPDEMRVPQPLTV